MKETRVELFKKYREEIGRMEDESSFTNKEKASRKVDTLLEEDKNMNNTSSLQLSFDDVIKTSEVYGGETKTRPNPLTPKDRKDKILHGVLVVITVLVIIALIVVGILYFKGV